MNVAGVIAILVGILIISSRGHLLLFPDSALRWFGKAIKTESRTRILGAVAILIAVTMVWSGMPQRFALETVLFTFGIFILLFAIPTLLLVPSIYMNLANLFLPDDLTGSLFGWRITGLVGVIIGVAFLMVGIDTL
ncbi:MAG: hypothetical protein VB962_06420 [Pseudohongiellaceae bacterium]|jgi:hypothetical protein|tara:strand:- start:32 stop:439 length:408 start_codon:yes stop_codon:yes gene_type:complete